MNVKPEKIYVPKSRAKMRETQYGQFMSVSFSAKELVQFIHANTNTRGYFNITLAPRRNSDETQTHSVYLDTWEPTNKAPLSAAQKAASGQPELVPTTPAPDDDVPF
jgi:hypothetical protein